MVDGIEFGRPRDHLANILNLVCRAADEMVRIEGVAEHALSLGECLHDVVRLVAKRRVLPFRIGIGDGDWSGRRFDRFQCRALSRMARVDNHADTVHLDDYLLSDVRDPGTINLEAASRGQGSIGVAESHETYTGCVPDLDQIDVILDQDWFGKRKMMAVQASLKARRMSVPVRP